MLLHIAHQIAMNRRCTVDYGYVSLEGTSANDHAWYDGSIDYDAGLIDEITARLEVVDEHRLAEFTVVAARDTASQPRTVSVVERAAGERPRWLALNTGHTGVLCGNRRWGPLFSGVSGHYRGGY